MTFGLIFLFLILGLLFIGFFIFEHRAIRSTELALIVSLAALAGIARVPFVWIPSIQPTTFIILFSGYVFGPWMGFVTGSSAAFISNYFLLQGPWTIWQMFGWGLVGISGGLTAFFVKEKPQKALLVLGFIWGFLFGWIMNLWHWLTYVYPLTFKTWLAVNSASILFDLAHAVGNVIFIFAFGKNFLLLLMRFKKKLFYVENK